jgi:dipeptide/tripeptide permease
MIFKLSQLFSFGMESCYPLAFGVPAVLMVVATLIFVAGYKRYVIVPPGGNVVTQLIRVIFNALKNFYRMRIRPSEPEEVANANSSDPLLPDASATVAPVHILDYAIPTYGRKLVDEVKQVVNILVLFIPLPFFWALYDQTASRWVGQARMMDPTVFGYEIKPEQMQLTNALLILIMIPLFDKGVYPLLRALGLPLRPLQRMATGMLFVGYVDRICLFHLLTFHLQ